MRFAVVASSVLALSLLSAQTEAGFPNGSLGPETPNYGAIGPQRRVGPQAPRRVAQAGQSVRGPRPYDHAYASPGPQYAEPQFAAPRVASLEPQRPMRYGTRRLPNVAITPALRQHPSAPRPAYRMAQFDHYGAPHSSMTAVPAAEAVQGGAIIQAPESGPAHAGGHVHGPGCADGNCGGETVHSDVLLNSVPDGPPETIAGPAYQTYQAPAYQEPIYQTYEGGYGGYDAAPYYESMSASSWDLGSATAACPTWFGGVYGLIMTRDGDEDFYTLATDADQTLLYMPSGSFETNFSGGIEGRVGRTFNCCRWGLELVYWGIFPNDARATFDVNVTPVPGNLQTVHDYAYATDALGNPITNYTDNLVYARAIRSEEYHNIEINLLSGPLTLSSAGGGCAPCSTAYSAVIGYDGGYGGGTYRGGGYPVYDQCGSDCGGCGNGGSYQYGYGDGYGQGFYGQGRGNAGCSEPKWIANWMFGVRYFRSLENVQLDYSSVGSGIQNVTGEVSHRYRADNDLVGVQLGVDLNRCLTKRFHLDLGSRFGLFGNHASTCQQIYTPDGFATVNPANPRDFDVRGSENDIAFLGELRVGAGYKVGKHLRFTGGYRAIAVSGVATALGQTVFGRELGALDKVADVDTDDSFVLHGAYVGSEFAW